MLDHKLNVKVETEGGFSSELSFVDLQRLRKIVKNVHMKLYPKELCTDLEADRMIDVMGPATRAYLIEKHWSQIK
jgi:hypothetical protein